MKEGTYVTIQSFMRTELGLSGNELLAYALVFGFCQDNESVFTGSMTYIAEWLGTTRQTAISTMKKLVDRGYVERIETVINGVTFVKYKALRGVKNFDGVLKDSQPCQKSLHNKDSYIDRDSNKNSSGVKKFVQPTIDEIARFCEERGNGVDAKKVFDYYSSAGWKDGRGNPVRNWKQKIIAVWEKPKEEKKIGKVAHESEVYDKDFNEDGTFRW